jgi:hypothetical protein
LFNKNGLSWDRNPQQSHRGNCKDQQNSPFRDPAQSQAGFGHSSRGGPPDDNGGNSPGGNGNSDDDNSSYKGESHDEDEEYPPTNDEEEFKEEITLLQSPGAQVRFAQSSSK